HAHVISLLLRQSGSRVAEVTERIEGSEGTGTTSTAVVTQTVREVDSQRLALYAGAAFVMGLMFGLILRRRS
ncbi:MAG: hypothetical protein QXU23_07965, partial [Candidatus Korarchaeum sp.]